MNLYIYFKFNLYILHESSFMGFKSENMYNISTSHLQYIDFLLRTNLEYFENAFVNNSMHV